MSDTGGADLDRLLDPNLPHTFRGLDPEAVQGLLTDAVDSLRAAQGREEELQSTVAALTTELATARAEATAELEQAKRRGRQMVSEAQLVRRRILEDLVRRRKVLRRQIEQLRVGRERLLEAYEVVGQTVEEATSELGVALVSATAAAERAGRRLGRDDEVTDEDLHAMEAEIEAARAAGLPILDPLTSAERRADVARDQPDAEEGDEDEDAVPPLVEVEPVVAAFEEMRVLGPVEEVIAEPEPEPLPDLIEAEPPEEDVLDPVAVLADDLSRRLRRVLADEQNQVLDRLRQDRKGQLTVADLLDDTNAQVVRLATAIEPRLREATEAASDLAARLAGEVVDGVHAEMAREAGDGLADEDGLVRPVRDAFRAWRTDRILPLATAVAQEALGS